MLTIEKRIAALEKSNGDDALHVIIVVDGETKAVALERSGLPPDARALFIDPIDADI